MIKLATGGAPFLPLYALQVTGSSLRVAQSWLPGLLSVKSLEEGHRLSTPSLKTSLFGSRFQKEHSVPVCALGAYH